jgi:hypothetical protein
VNGLQLLTGRSRIGAADLTFNQWAGLWSLDSLDSFVIPSLSSPTSELPDGRLPGMIASVYARNGVVFAVEALRLAVFSEARPQFRQLRAGRPGDLFGTQDLRLLEHPWPGGTFSDLAARALLSADAAGAGFIVRRPTKLEVLRPDWMTVVSGILGDPEATSWDIDATILAFAYQPGGPGSNEPVEYLDPADVAHFTGVTPDPLSPSKRGVPWMHPILREVFADQAATRFKQAFFDNGATPSMIISIDKSVVPEKWREWIKIFKEKHEGARNAFRTLYLGAGATAQVVGAGFDKLDFRNLAAGAEIRICAAGGVPPVLVGISGGSGSGSAIGSTSDYAPARRRFADGTIRPLWRNFFGSLETIVPPPPGSQLWYDDSDVPFLREDLKDSAEIDQVQAQTIVALIRDGFEPDVAVKAVTSGDLTLLAGNHNGFISVQQQAIAFPGEAGPGAKVTKPAQPQLGPGNQAAAARRTGPIVTAADVLAKRAELQAAGLDAGYDSLARELFVSAATVRRRLGVLGDKPEGTPE